MTPEEIEAKKKELDGIKLYDIVEIGPDDPRTTRRPKPARQFIITSIEPGFYHRRTKGVLISGKGTEYPVSLSIGDDYPLIVGHAEQNHPALIAFRKKRG